MTCNSPGGEDSTRNQIMLEGFMKYMDSEARQKSLGWLRQMWHWDKEGGSWSIDSTKIVSSVVTVLRMRHLVRHPNWNLNWELDMQLWPLEKRSGRKYELERHQGKDDWSFSWRDYWVRRAQSICPRLEQCQILKVRRDRGAQKGLRKSISKWRREVMKH